VDIQGKWNEDLKTVKEFVIDFYTNRLSAVEDLGVRVDNIEFKMLSGNDYNVLISPF